MLTILLKSGFNGEETNYRTVREITIDYTHLHIHESNGTPQTSSRLMTGMIAITGRTNKFQHIQPLFQTPNNTSFQWQTFHDNINLLIH